MPDGRTLLDAEFQKRQRQADERAAAAAAATAAATAATTVSKRPSGKFSKWSCVRLPDRRDDTPFTRLRTHSLPLSNICSDTDLYSAFQPRGSPEADRD